MTQKPQLTLQEKEQVAKVRSLLREGGKNFLSCANVNMFLLVVKWGSMLSVPREQLIWVAVLGGSLVGILCSYLNLS